MRGVNRVILVGTLGKDPETKTFPNGGQICTFSIATNDSWTDKNTGERKTSTEWHRIVVNGKTAEIAQQYAKKGNHVYIEGSIKTRQYTDQNGMERSVTEINCVNFQLLDSPNQNQQANNHNQQGRSYGGNSGNIGQYGQYDKRSNDHGSFSNNGYQYNPGFTSR